MPISKAADSYYHVTSVGNLRNVLDSGGRLSTLRHIAIDDPDRELDVEMSPLPVQVRTSARKAYDRLKDVKNVDAVHFTRGGYLPGYGDVVIRKELGSSARKRLAANTIPEEYTTRRKVSLLNSDIYVPTANLDELRGEYGKRYRMHDRSELDAKPYGVWDRAKALGRKTAYKLGLRDDF